MILISRSFRFVRIHTCMHRSWAGDLHICMTNQQISKGATCCAKGEPIRRHLNIKMQQWFYCQLLGRICGDCGSHRSLELSTASGGSRAQPKPVDAKLSSTWSMNLKASQLVGTIQAKQVERKYSRPPLLLWESPTMCRTITSDWMEAGLTKPPDRGKVLIHVIRFWFTINCGGRRSRFLAVESPMLSHTQPYIYC